MLARLLTIASLSVLFNSLSQAEIPFEQAKGLYQATKDDQKENSPLWGMVALKTQTLERLRFFGNFGPYSKQTDLFHNEYQMQEHLQSLGLWRKPVNPNQPNPLRFEKKWQEVTDVPQDALAALIQYLFPSPDGAIFVANERLGDPLKKLVHTGEKTFSGLNRLLSVLITFKENQQNKKEIPHKDLERLKQNIITVLSFENPKGELSDKKQLAKIRKAQRILAWQRNLQAKQLLRKKLQKKEDERLTKEEWTKYKNSVRKSVQQYVPKEEKAKGPEKTIKKFNQRKYTRKYTRLNETAIENLATILTQAMHQELTQDDTSSLYPKNIVVTALLAYAWKVGNKKTDLAALAVLFKEGTHLKESQNFSVVEYLDEKQAVLQDLQQTSSMQVSRLSPETMALFREGYSAYEEVIPSLISYKMHVAYRHQTYPDCGETSLRNFFYIVFNDHGHFNPTYFATFVKEKLGEKTWSAPKGGENVQINDQQDPLTQLYLYFMKYPSPSSGGSQQAHDEWSLIVSNLNQKTETNKKIAETCPIKYGPFSKCPDCEIGPGLINMLNVIAHLIPDETLRKGWQEKEKFKQAAEKLNRVSELFSRDNFKLAWDIQGKREVLKGTGIKITFAINDKNAFDWTMNPMHFEIKKVQSAGWPHTVSWANQKFENFPWLQSWFVKPDDLTHPLYLQQAPAFLIFGQDLRNNDVMVQVADYLFTKQYLDFYPLVVKRLRTLFSDQHSLTQVKAMMIGHPDQRTLFTEAEQEKLKIGEKEIKNLLFNYILRYGYLSSLETLIKQDEKIVNAQDEYGKTPLHQAARNGQQAVTTLLLEKGAEVNAQDKDGATPLHQAANNGHQAVVALLLEKGTEVNLQGQYGKTPLHLAASEGHQEVVTLLLEKGAKVNTKDENGYTPLHLAALKGRQAVLVVLLEKGAKVNAQNTYGSTPLHQAAWNGNQAVVALLLEKGADVNAKDKDGYTPLHRAVYWGHQEVVALLLEKGAEINAKDNGGYTPLHLATNKGHQAVVALLLEKGADVNAKDNGGYTPLHFAANNGHQAVVALLLENGAKVKQKDIDVAKTYHIKQLLQKALKL
jgi:ankyrin repeat protein